MEEKTKEKPKRLVRLKDRFEVFKRDLFTCQYCGQKPPVVVLEIDHIVPVSDGGDSHESNLITSCFECNRGKSDRSLTVIPSSLQDQIEERRERAEQVEAYNAFLLEIRAKEDRVVNDLGKHWFRYVYGDKSAYIFGTGRTPSIRRFLGHLTPAEIMEAIDIAFARIRVYGDADEKCWRYFCGVCWGKIRERGER